MDVRCQMVFKKFSELESHLDVGEHHQARGGSATVYDKLRRDWAEKSLTVDNNEETGRALVVITMSNVTKMKLLVLVVTYSLAGLYTSLVVKLCGLQMRLNSTYNHEIRPRRENWQQSRSRKKWLQT